MPACAKPLRRRQGGGYGTGGGGPFDKLRAGLW